MLWYFPGTARVYTRPDKGGPSKQRRSTSQLLWQWRKVSCMISLATSWRWITLVVQF